MLASSSFFALGFLTVVGLGVTTTSSSLSSFFALGFLTVVGLGVTTTSSSLSSFFALGFLTVLGLGVTTTGAMSSSDPKSFEISVVAFFAEDLALVTVLSLGVCLLQYTPDFGVTSHCSPARAPEKIYSHCFFVRCDLALGFFSFMSIPEMTFHCSITSVD